MGAECSVDRKDKLKDKSKKEDEDIEINSLDISSLSRSFFDCKNYKEYIIKMEILKQKIKDIIYKIENRTDFSLNKNTQDKIENSYHAFLYTTRMQRLFELAILSYQKITQVFGSDFNLPKQELSKIDYKLIAKYLAYEFEDDDEYTSNITDKIIKRINFFSAEFPLKLNKLEKIITSEKIFIFGYDIYYRLTFYIRPFFQTPDDLFTINLEKIDYIIYIFFIAENVMPILREKYNFSEQLNIIIDFDDKDADTELIRFILFYLNNFFPLILGKMHVIKFQINNLKKNISFRKELETLNLFKNIEFHNKSFKFQIIRDYYPNCLPIEYGGYHSLENKKIKKDFKLDDFIEFIISMILVKAE